MKKLFLFAVIAALQLHQARAQHVDTIPYYELDGSGNRTLSVGSFDLMGANDGSQSVKRNVLLFTGGAGITSSTPPGSVVNANPGWNRPFDFNSPWEGDGMFGASYPAGTAPSGYGELGFNVVVDPRLGLNLAYWNGTGTPSFGPVPSGETLDLYYPNPFGGPLSGNLVTLAGEPIGKPGFNITQGNGLHPGFHEHTAAVLWGSATHDPADMPAEGYYLYSRTLTVTNDVIETGGFPMIIPGTQTSPVFHTLLSYHPSAPVIYEYGDIIYEYQYDEYGDILYDDEENPLLLLDAFGQPVPQLDDLGNPLREVFTRFPAHEAAVDWVNNNLGAPVPEPSSLVLVGVCAIASCPLRVRRNDRAPTIS